MEERFNNVCVVIPAYREAGRIGEVVKSALVFCGKVFVVDDGSDDSTGESARAAGATVIRHEVNRGKGAALNTGFAAAADSGFEYVVTMDADGQHDSRDIPAFVDVAKRTGAGVIVGTRMASVKGMPFVRRCVNVFMSWLLSRKMGQRVPDTQCGFRLYAVKVASGVSIESQRFEAESEILLKLSRRGERIESAPVRMIYADERSKIRPIRDTVRFFAMLRRFGRMHDEKSVVE